MAQFEAGARKGWNGRPERADECGCHYLSDFEGDVVIGRWCPGHGNPPSWQMHGSDDEPGSEDMVHEDYSYLGPVPDFEGRKAT